MSIARLNRFDGLKVPKKISELQLLQKISIDSNDFIQEIRPILQNSFKLPTSLENIVFDTAFFINTPSLLKLYSDAKNEFRNKSNYDSTERYAFILLSDFNQIKNISLNGLSIGNCNNSKIGSPDQGVILSLCADIVLDENDRYSSWGYLLCFKYVRGRVNSVLEHDEPLDPTADFDCHISNKFNNFSVPSALAMNSINYLSLYYTTQIYLFEFDKDLEIVVRPRLILPFFCVKLHHSRQYFSLTTCLLKTKNQDNLVVQNKILQNGNTSQTCEIGNESNSQSEKKFFLSLNNYSRANCPIKSKRDSLGVRQFSKNPHSALGQPEHFFVPLFFTQISLKNSPNCSFLVELRSINNSFTLHPLLNQSNLVISKLTFWESLYVYLDPRLNTPSSLVNKDSLVLIDPCSVKILKHRHQMQIDKILNSYKQLKAKSEPDINSVPSEIQKPKFPRRQIVCYYRAVCVNPAQNRASMTNVASALNKKQKIGIIDLNVSTDAMCFIFPDCEKAHQLGISPPALEEVNCFHIILISFQENVLRDEILFYQEICLQIPMIYEFAKSINTETNSSAHNTMPPPVNITNENIQRFVHYLNLMQKQSLFHMLRGSMLKFTYPDLVKKFPLVDVSSHDTNTNINYSMTTEHLPTLTSPNSIPTMSPHNSKQPEETRNSENCDEISASSHNNIQTIAEITCPEPTDSSEITSDTKQPVFVSKFLNADEAAAKIDTLLNEIDGLQFSGFRREDEICQQAQFIKLKTKSLIVNPCNIYNSIFSHVFRCRLRRCMAGGCTNSTSSGTSSSRLPLIPTARRKISITSRDQNSASSSAYKFIESSKENQRSDKESEIDSDWSDSSNLSSVTQPCLKEENPPAQPPSVLPSKPEPKSDTGSILPRQFIGMTPISSPDKFQLPKNRRKRFDNSSFKYDHVIDKKLHLTRNTVDYSDI